MHWHRVHLSKIKSLESVLTCMDMFMTPSGRSRSLSSKATLQRPENGGTQVETASPKRLRVLFSGFQKQDSWKAPTFKGSCRKITRFDQPSAAHFPTAGVDAVVLLSPPRIFCDLDPSCSCCWQELNGQYLEQPDQSIQGKAGVSSDSNFWPLQMPFLIA